MAPLFFALTLLFGGVSPVPLELDVDGVQRTAVIYPNRGATPAEGAPLVLVFHGHGGNAARQARKLAIHKAWPEAIVVYPQGLTGIRGRTDFSGTRTGWQKFVGEVGDRDFKFVDALLVELKRRYRVDPTRIYAMGHSNGGRFAGVLWAMRGKEFAAICSASGQAGGMIESAPPRPVFMIMGERDRLVPYASQAWSIELARKRLGADPEKATADGCYRTEPGPDGLELATYIHPGGHPWPDAATPYVVEFFKRHRLRSSSGK